MFEFHVFTEVFNPRVGVVECFLCSVFARSLAEAKQRGRREIERGEVLIVRPVK